jgi:hypothetical protein
VLEFGGIPSKFRCFCRELLRNFVRRGGDHTPGVGAGSGRSTLLHVELTRVGSAGWRGEPNRDSDMRARRSARTGPCARSTVLQYTDSPVSDLDRRWSWYGSHSWKPLHNAKEDEYKYYRNTSHIQQCGAFSFLFENSVYRYFLHLIMKLI